MSTAANALDLRHCPPGLVLERPEDEIQVREPIWRILR